MMKKIRETKAGCAGCGKELLPHAKFCHGCGYRVAISRARKMTTRRKIAGAALLAVAVIIGMFFVYSQISKQRVPSAGYSYGYGAAGAIEDAQISPVGGGQNSVFVTVRNTSDRGATFQVELSSWAGTTVRDVYLPAGGSEGLAFDVAQVQGGNLTISLYVNGTFLDRKVVSAASAPQPQTDQPQNDVQVIPQISGAITNVQVPSSVDENQATTASVTVNNTGNADATFQVKLTYSASTISKEVQVPKGDSRVLTFNLTPKRDDSNVAVLLYSGSALLDQKTAAMTVLYVGGTVTSIQVPATVEEGVTESISVIVKNTGNKSATFEVRLDTSSNSYSQQTYLTAGGSKTVFFGTTLARGQQSISVSLRSEGTLFSTEQTFVTVTYVDGEITSYDVPSTAVEGETIQIPVTVKNTGTKGAYFQVGLVSNRSSTVSEQVWLNSGSSRNLTLNIKLYRNDSRIDLRLIYGNRTLDSLSESVDVDYDADGDGLYNSREIELGTNPNNVDTDKDGLSDWLEVNTLAPYGANPLRRDIFVEIDRMEGVGGLSWIQEGRLTDAFKNAPLQNPDGSWGVDLHLYYDDVITPAKSIYNSSDYYTYERRYHDFPDGFRWALFAGIWDWWDFPRPAGLCYGEGFVVDRDAPFSPIAHVFMHELGHSLGLMPSVYGGIDSTSWPWDYDSVMNYGSQLYTLGLKLDYSRGGDFNDWAYLGNGFTNYWSRRY